MLDMTSVKLCIAYNRNAFNHLVIKSDQLCYHAYNVRCILKYSVKIISNNANINKIYNGFDIRSRQMKTTNKLKKLKHI